MKTLDLKQNFFIASFLQTILENSEKQFPDSNMQYINDQVGFDDSQKAAMKAFVRNFVEYINSLYK